MNGTCAARVIINSPLYHYRANRGPIAVRKLEMRSLLQNCTPTRSKIIAEHREMGVAVLRIYKEYCHPRLVYGNKFLTLRTLFWRCLQPLVRGKFENIFDQTLYLVLVPIYDFKHFIKIFLLTWLTWCDNFPRGIFRQISVKYSNKIECEKVRIPKVTRLQSHYN